MTEPKRCCEKCRKNNAPPYSLPQKYCDTCPCHTPDAPTEEIDTFVRDVCSIVPKSKSEVRGRLDQIITQALAEQKARMVEVLEGMKTETTWMKDSPYSYKVRAIDEAITIIKALSK